MTLQDPDKATIASKLTLPSLGGGTKTSRGVFQSNSFSSCAFCQAMCQPNQLWTAIYHKPLSKHLINWGWQSGGTCQAPPTWTESPRLKAQIEFPRNTRGQSYSSSQSFSLQEFLWQTLPLPPELSHLWKPVNKHCKTTTSEMKKIQLPCWGGHTVFCYTSLKALLNISNSYIWLQSILHDVIYFLSDVKTTFFFSYMLTLLMLHFITRDFGGVPYLGVLAKQNLFSHTYKLCENQF